VVVVARTSTPREFGAFSIAYSLALLTIGGIRGAVGETLSVMIHDRSDGAAALGASLLIGTATGLTVGLLGILWPEPGLKPWLLSFAVGLPLLAMQDAGRFVGFASGRPGVAALSDGIWLTLQVVLWLAFAASGALTGISALMGWVAVGRNRRPHGLGRDAETGHPRWVALAEAVPTGGVELR
jgi:O-antigen/teichoic acid export membrane protein